MFSLENENRVSKIDDILQVLCQPHRRPDLNAVIQLHHHLLLGNRAVLADGVPREIDSRPGERAGPTRIDDEARRIEGVPAGGAGLDRADLRTAILGEPAQGAGHRHAERDPGGECRVGASKRAPSRRCLDCLAAYPIHAMKTFLADVSTFAAVETRYLPLRVGIGGGNHSGTPENVSCAWAVA